ncbi:hypothetical protein NKH55_20540 [Mesorhizobium opportunistum]|uniref:hypothetical protein n=1 Tax=Mesorhizobium opportunistum TaxID=593909 RepID=UPI00333DBF16
MDEDSDWDDFRPRAVSARFVFNRHFFGSDAIEIFSRHCDLLKKIDGGIFRVKLEGCDDTFAAIDVEQIESQQFGQSHSTYPQLNINFVVEINCIEDIESYWRYGSDTDVTWVEKVEYWLNSSSEEIASQCIFIVSALSFLADAPQGMESVGYIFRDRYHPLSRRSSNLLHRGKFEGIKELDDVDFKSFIHFYDDILFKDRPNREGIKYYFEEMLVPSHQRDLLLDVTFLFALIEPLFSLGESGKISELRGKLRACGIALGEKDYLRDAYQIRSMFVHGGLGEISPKHVNTISMAHRYLCNLIRKSIILMFKKKSSFLEFEWQLK